jgi:hypothetical protein
VSRPLGGFNRASGGSNKGHDKKERIAVDILESVDVCVSRRDDEFKVDRTRQEAGERRTAFFMDNHTICSVQPRRPKGTRRTVALA